TQLTYHFNRRTAEPLGPSPAPGCDEPTSRCQTLPSIWTLGEYQPVIPGVPLSVERWPTHAGPPDHYDRLSSLLDLLVSQSGWLMPLHSKRPISDRSEPTIARLRYSLGGDRPSQTTRHALSRPRMTGRG